jgi:hypothetical protein
MNDSMPITDRYRGVGLHDFQPLDHINDVVKPGIDAVHSTNDVEALCRYGCDYRNPPEARLFAAAKVRAIFETRAGAHESRGNVDMERLSASTTGLGARIPRHSGLI